MHLVESVGVTIALGSALVRTKADVVLAFDEQGGVHEELENVCEALSETFGKKNLDELVLEGIVGLFLHGFGVLPKQLKTKDLERTPQPFLQRAAGMRGKCCGDFTEEILHYQY